MDLGLQLLLLVQGQLAAQTANQRQITCLPLTAVTHFRLQDFTNIHTQLDLGCQDTEHTGSEVNDKNWFSEEFAPAGSAAAAQSVVLYGRLAAPHGLSPIGRRVHPCCPAVHWMLRALQLGSHFLHSSTHPRPLLPVWDLCESKLDVRCQKHQRQCTCMPCCNIAHGIAPAQLATVH